MNFKEYLNESKITIDVDYTVEPGQEKTATKIAKKYKIKVKKNREHNC